MNVLSPLARRLLVIALILLAAWFYSSTRPVGQPDGVLAPDPPVERPLEGEPQTFERNGFILRPLARFSADARVLSVQRYARDRESRVSPADAAIGWGALSDSAVLRSTDIAQDKRQLFYRSYDPALPDAEAVKLMLNLHLVPADGATEEAIVRLRAGQRVLLEGDLVEVAGPENWRWRGDAGEAGVTAPSRVLRVTRLEVQ